MALAPPDAAGEPLGGGMKNGPGERVSGEPIGLAPRVRGITGVGDLMSGLWMNSRYW